jgi:hypothetical protein
MQELICILIGAEFAATAAVRVLSNSSILSRAKRSPTAESFRLFLVFSSRETVSSVLKCLVKRKSFISLIY